MARVLLGVTGGIAAYKAAELCRLLVKAGHDVVPVLTPGAQRFVTPETFRALARRDADEGSYPHLERFDLVVIAPLTANTMAKLAYGIADNVLTEAVLAHKGPILVAPAMNPRMWSNAATRANVRTIQARAASSSSARTRERWLRASGEWGGWPSRRRSPPGPAAPRAGAARGLHVLVTAGGTREPVDSVRFVGNRSSGRMGVALAEEARRRGADVTLLAANLAVPPPVRVATIDTPTAERMLDAGLALEDVDIALLAAAVADYRPAETLATKRPKSSSSWTLELEPTPDIALRWESASVLARCWSPSAPSTGRRGSNGSAACSRTRAPTWSSTTTSPRGHRLRRGRQRGRPCHRGRRPPHPQGEQA